MNEDCKVPEIAGEQRNGSTATYNELISIKRIETS